MKTFAAVASATAILLLMALPASAATKHHRHLSQSARGAYASQPQIAYTVAGCMPIPRGCHPEMGYTPRGTPTGFDVAVCGNVTLYGYRR